ncbi:MAG: glutamyl-tRNA reductase, partial [Verrucomicrobia bacterium]
MLTKENYSLFMLGCSHNSAPLHIRESFSILENTESALYNNLLLNKNILEVLVLNTCNRIEIYLVAHPGLNKEDIIDTYCHTQKLIKEDCLPYFSIIRDQQVIQHLFEVASGIDSQLIGETEILSQVKLGYQKAQKYGAIGKVLNRILQKSFQAAKWAHTHTGISKGQISIASIACDLALRIFGDLSSTRILIIGSGEIGEKTLHALKLRGAKDLTITNRTHEQACILAEQFSATAIPYPDFPQKINLFDIVICSTSAPNV